MRTEEITSLQNPKEKKAVKLTDRRERNRTGLFLIERVSRAQNGLQIVV